MTLPTIVSFWHGPLSWLEHLSIISYRRRGHPVSVYSYDRIENLPEGAVWHDANTVLPQEKLIFYKGKGTPAVFSDHFRCAALKLNLGVYSDLDVYCVRPIHGPPDYLLAWERPGSVNNAVMHIPADAPLLDDLLAIFGQKRPLIEPHLTPMRRVEVAMRRLFGDPVPPENMQFGATGPMALTYHLKKRALLKRVLPAETFYPIPYEGIPALNKAGSSVESAITEDTLGIHLWRSQLTNRGRAGMPLPEAGSALAALCRAENFDPASV